MLRAARAGPSPRSPTSPEKRHSASQNSSRWSTDQRHTSCGSAPPFPIASKKRATTAVRRRSSDGSQSSAPSSTIPQAYHRRLSTEASATVARRQRLDHGAGVLQEPDPELAVAHG